MMLRYKHEDPDQRLKVMVKLGKDLSPSWSIYAGGAHDAQPQAIPYSLVPIKGFVSVLGTLHDHDLHSKKKLRLTPQNLVLPRSRPEAPKKGSPKKGSETLLHLLKNRMEVACHLI